MDMEDQQEQQQAVPEQQSNMSLVKDSEHEQSATSNQAPEAPSKHYTPQAIKKKETFLTSMAEDDGKDQESNNDYKVAQRSPLTNSVKVSDSTYHFALTRLILFRLLRAQRRQQWTTTTTTPIDLSHQDYINKGGKLEEPQV